MQIVDQFGNPVYAARTFAKAADRCDRSRPPEQLYKDDFEKLIPNWDRQWIVSAARSLFQNYGPITGAIIQKADHAVGRAWVPRFLGQDKEWGRIAKEWLENQWYGNCDIRGRSWDFKTLLWLDSVAIDRDGDFLIVLTEGESGYPLVQRISVNRIGQRFSGPTVPDGPYKGRKCSHGIIRNEVDRPLAYIVLGDKLDDDRVIEAARAIHVFDPLWHDQVRGIPSFSNSIKLIYGSMTATEREQLNQLIRSSWAIMEWNESGMPDGDNPSVVIGQAATADAPATATVETLAGGMIKYFKSGSGGKLEALDNNMPGDSWDRFQDRIVRTAMTGINWPTELVWKSSDVNAALVRNIQNRAQSSVEDRQDVLRNPAIFTIRYAVAKAIKIGLLPKPKNAADWWKWDFQMPRKFSVDQSKDAQQRRADYRAGIKNFSQIIMEEGGDPEQVEDDRINEVIRRARKIKEAKEANPDLVIDDREFFMLTENEPSETAPAANPNDQQQ